MIGTKTNNKNDRRPRPDMDVELNDSFPKVQSRDLPTSQSRDLPEKNDAETKNSDETNNNEDVPESINGFISKTASTVGVEEAQVKTVVTTILDLVQKHAPPDVVNTISSKVPGADKFLTKPDDAPTTEEKEGEEEAADAPVTEEVVEEEEAAADEEKNTNDNENDEVQQSRAAPAAVSEQEEEPASKSCLPGFLQNFLQKATGGKALDAATATETMAKAGVTPDKAKEISTKFLDFLKDKVGDDKVHQIVEKFPGLKSLTG